MTPSPPVGGTYGAITWIAVILAPCTFASSAAALAALSESADPSVGTRMWRNMRRPSVLLVDHHGAQARRVQDADVLLLHGDELVRLEAREEPAHGLERKSQVAPDLVARHAQVELVGRVAAGYEALGEVQEEGGEAL